MTVRVTVKQAAGLPPSLSHFVFCQYNFWSDELIIVPPVIHNNNSSHNLNSNSFYGGSNGSSSSNDSCCNNNEGVSNSSNGNGILTAKRRSRDMDKDGSLNFKFDHTKEFVIVMTEEFIEYCSEGALSVEVYGHRSAVPVGLNPDQSTWDPEQQLAKARSLADR